MVHGFRQRAGVDFTEMFAPVVKPDMICTVLQLAVSGGWPVHQMDVSNAFLHGHLEEQVYCEQPTGFVDASLPGLLCLELALVFLEEERVMQHSSVSISLSF